MGCAWRRIICINYNYPWYVDVACGTHIYTCNMKEKCIGIIALHVHENIARHGCECMVRIGTVECHGYTVVDQHCVWC